MGNGSPRITDQVSDPLKDCGDCWADGDVAEVNWNDPKSIEEAVQRFAEQK